MTHVDNLPIILQSGELRSTVLLQGVAEHVTSIAYTSIQQQRAMKPVPCRAGGCLHDYVPFYFCRKSPMLYTISRGNVPCEGGQDALVHMVSTAQAVAQAGLPFVFSDGHGIMAYTEFFDDLDEMRAVDWNVIAARYWHDTPDDGDRKRRRQAEFLVRDRFPLNLLQEIVVRSAAARDHVEALLNQANVAVPVTVNSAWYY